MRRILTALFLVLAATATLAADPGWREKIEPRWYVGGGPFYLNDEIGATALVAYHTRKNGALFLFGPTWIHTGGDRYMVPPGGRTGMEWTYHRPPGRDVLYVTPERSRLGVQFTVLFSVD